jgi:hypothetical protein
VNIEIEQTLIAATSDVRAKEERRRLADREL